MIFIKSGPGNWSVALLVCGAILAVAAAACISAPMRVATEDSAEPEWLVYSCEKYGFSIKYPTGYKVIEAKPRSETKSIWGAEVLSVSELYKVTFIETEYEMWPGLFEISVLSKEDSLGLEEWVESFFIHEDVALTVPNPEDPSMFGVGEVTVDGNPVVRMHLFNYDHTGIELFVAHGGLIYKLGFAGSNPNDPRVKEHMALYKEMVGSFEFGR